MSWEIDYYSYKKLPDKNSGFKNMEKSGRVATLQMEDGVFEHCARDFFLNGSFLSVLNCC